MFLLSLCLFVHFSSFYCHPHLEEGSWFSGELIDKEGGRVVGWGGGGDTQLPSLLLFYREHLSRFLFFDFVKYYVFNMKKRVLVWTKCFFDEKVYEIKFQFTFSFVQEIGSFNIYSNKSGLTFFFDAKKVHGFLIAKYSQTWANDHLRVAITCLWRPSFCSSIWNFHNIYIFRATTIVNNGHSF